MSQEMIFNCSAHEMRIAVLANSILTNLYIERPDGKSVGGNIYLGRVVRVLPGMQAAFVDIGLERAAFLHVSDTYHDISALELLINEEDEEIEERGLLTLESKLYQKETEYQIEDVLKDGQELLVQIAKEPVGTKGARVTTYISLPGRKLVLMPTVQHIGISRQITDVIGATRYTSGLDLSPDGALYGGTSELRRFNPTNGSTTLIGPFLTAGGSNVTMHNMTFHSNGTLYGFGLIDDGLYTIDLATARITQLGTITDTVVCV